MTRSELITQHQEQFDRLLVLLALRGMNERINCIRGQPDIKWAYWTPWPKRIDTFDTFEELEAFVYDLQS